MGVLDWIIVAVIGTAFILSIVYSVRHKGCGCSDCTRCAKSCSKRK